MEIPNNEGLQALKYLIASAWKCARFSKKVVTLTPLSPRADIVPKKSMEKSATNVTKRRNQENSIDPHLPSTKPCCQTFLPQKLQILRNDPETEQTFLYKHLFHSNASKA